MEESKPNFRQLNDVAHAKKYNNCKKKKSKQGNQAKKLKHCSGKVKGKQKLNKL